MGGDLPFWGALGAPAATFTHSPVEPTFRNEQRALLLLYLQLAHEPPKMPSTTTQAWPGNGPRPLVQRVHEEAISSPTCWATQASALALWSRWNLSVTVVTARRVSRLARVRSTREREMLGMVRPAKKRGPPRVSIFHVFSGVCLPFSNDESSLGMAGAARL